MEEARRRVARSDSSSSSGSSSEEVRTFLYHLEFNIQHNWMSTIVKNPKTPLLYFWQHLIFFSVPPPRLQLQQQQLQHWVHNRLLIFFGPFLPCFSHKQLLPHLLQLPLQLQLQLVPPLPLVNQGSISEFIPVFIDFVFFPLGWFNITVSFCGFYCLQYVLNKLYKQKTWMKYAFLKMKLWKNVH